MKNNKNKYLLVNMGCDDCTETELELTKEELQFLIKISNENNKNSTYGCQPKMFIYDKYTKDDDYYSYYDSKSLTEDDY